MLNQYNSDTSVSAQNMGNIIELYENLKIQPVLPNP